MVFIFIKRQLLDNELTVSFVGGGGEKGERERERDSQLYIFIKRSLIKLPSFCHFKERTKFIDYNLNMKQFVNSANI